MLHYRIPCGVIEPHSSTLTSLHLRYSTFSNPFRRFTYVTAHSPTHSATSRTSLLILQLLPLHVCHSSFSSPFCRFTSVIAHSPTPSVLHLRHSTLSNPFRRFAYVTAHSPTHSAASPTSQLILQPFRCFTYVTAHSPTLLSLHQRHSSYSNLPSLYLRHSSFSTPSVASPTSQLIFHSFRCFAYVTAHSLTFLSLLLRHRLFIYVTWRAAHDFFTVRRWRLL